MKQVRITFEYCNLSKRKDEEMSVVLPMREDFAEDVANSCKYSITPPFSILNALKAVSQINGGSFNRIIGAEILGPVTRWLVSWSNHEGNEECIEFDNAKDAFLEAEALHQRYDGVDVTPID